MSGNNLVPATWPDSESEFVIRDRRYAAAIYTAALAILNRNGSPPHLSGPAMVEILDVYRADRVAGDARGLLSALWCERMAKRIATD